MLDPAPTLVRPCGFSLSNPTGAVRRVMTAKCSRSILAFPLDWRRRNSAARMPGVESCQRIQISFDQSSAAEGSVHVLGSDRLIWWLDLPRQTASIGSSSANRVMRRGILLSSRRSATRSGQRGLVGSLSSDDPTALLGFISLRRFAPTEKAATVFPPRAVPHAVHARFLTRPFSSSRSDADFS